MSNQLAVSKKIDGIVLSVIGKKGLSGFEKAFTVSSAILELETILDEQHEAYYGFTRYVTGF
jgi:hypothetical protein